MNDICWLLKVLYPGIMTLQGHYICHRAPPRILIGAKSCILWQPLKSKNRDLALSKIYGQCEVVFFYTFSLWPCTTQRFPCYFHFVEWAENPRLTSYISGHFSYLPIISLHFISFPIISFFSPIIPIFFLIQFHIIYHFFHFISPIISVFISNLHIFS